MMGQHDRSEALFHYFRYSEMDRPSIDPELLLRILLIGYLYGITSKRKLVEELCMHLAWRWFTGLGFDQEIPHHSTFSKNRHGQFQESKLFEELFEQIVRQCVEVGLVEGKHLSVDGSFVEANAAKESRIPRNSSWKRNHYVSRAFRQLRGSSTLPWMTSLTSMLNQLEQERFYLASQIESVSNARPQINDRGECQSTRLFRSPSLGSSIC